MTNDYTWPSIYFSYLFFTLTFGLSLYFCIRCVKAGYWGSDAEAVTRHVFDEDVTPAGSEDRRTDESARGGEESPRHKHRRIS